MDADSKITRKKYLMGREAEYPTTTEMESNIVRLLHRVNALLSELTPLAPPFVVASGYRPGHYNTMARGATNSAHTTCEAIDIGDVTGNIKARITTDLLVKHDLYMEHPDATIGWCHLTTRAPHSGRRKFLP